MGSQETRRRGRTDELRKKELDLKTHLGIGSKMFTDELRISEKGILGRIVSDGEVSIPGSVHTSSKNELPQTMAQVEGYMAWCMVRHIRNLIKKSNDTQMTDS